jgi:hypothetical protein
MEPAPAVVALAVLAGIAVLALLALFFHLIHRRQRRRTPERMPYPFILDPERPLPPPVLPNMRQVTQGSAVHPARASSMPPVIDITLRPPSPVTFRPTSIAASSVTNIPTTRSSSYSFAPTLPSIGRGYNYADRMYTRMQETQADAQFARYLGDHPSVMQDNTQSRYSVASSAPSLSSRRSVAIAPDAVSNRTREGQPPVPPIPNSLRPGLLEHPAWSISAYPCLGQVSRPEGRLSQVISSSVSTTLSTDEIVSPPTVSKSSLSAQDSMTLRPIREQRPQLRIDTGGPAPMLPAPVPLPELAVPMKAARKHSRRR